MGEHEEFWRFSWASVKTLRLKKPARWRVFFQHGPRPSQLALIANWAFHSLAAQGWAGISTWTIWSEHGILNTRTQDMTHRKSSEVWLWPGTFRFTDAKETNLPGLLQQSGQCGLVVQHQHDLWWSDRRHWCLSKTSADLLEANFIKISRHFTPVCWTNLETPFSAQSLQRGQWNDQTTPCTCTCIKHIKTLQLLRHVPFYNLLQLLHVTEVQDKAFRFAGNFHPMDPMVLEYSARPETAGCNPGPTLAAIISNIQPWRIS